MEEQNNNEVLNNELENVEVNEEAIKKAKKNKLIKIAVGGLIGIGGIFLAVALGHKKTKLEEVPYEPTSIEHDLPDYTPSVTPINPIEEIEDNNTYEENVGQTEEDYIKSLGTTDKVLDGNYTELNDAVIALEQKYGIELNQYQGTDIARFARYSCGIDDPANIDSDIMFFNGIRNLICQEGKRWDPPISWLNSSESPFSYDYLYVHAVYTDDYVENSGDIEVTKMPSDFSKVLDDAHRIYVYSQSGIADKTIVANAYLALSNRMIEISFKDAAGAYTADDFSFNIPELTYKGNGQDDYEENNDYNNDNNGDEYDGYSNPYGEGDILIKSNPVPQLVKKA